MRLSQSHDSDDYLHGWKGGKKLLVYEACFISFSDSLQVFAGIYKQYNKSNFVSTLSKQSLTRATWIPSHLD